MKKSKIVLGALLVANIILFVSLIFTSNNQFLTAKEGTVQIDNSKSLCEEIEGKEDDENYVETPHIIMTKMQFELLPKTETDVVFVGDSLTEFGWWEEWFPDSDVKNRGISGDIIRGVYQRIDDVVELTPNKVFLMIGVNDLYQGSSVETIEKNYSLLCQRMSKEMPNTQIYLQSILPTNDAEKNMEIIFINQVISENAKKYEFEYVDLYSIFVDDTGLIKEKYSIDGVHLSGEAYMIWVEKLKNYIE